MADENVKNEENLGQEVDASSLYLLFCFVNTN